MKTQALMKNTDTRPSGQRAAHQEQIENCRICGEEAFTVLDLGHHPFANSLITSPKEVVKTYPLNLLVCKGCSTAQLSFCADDKELYADYNYITPDSESLTSHYSQLLEFLKQNDYIDTSSKVLEIGSNVGRLLAFLKPHVHSTLGVDPAKNIVEMAEKNGIPTVNDFFDKVSARKIMDNHGKIDMIIARHCFAHNEKPWLMLEGVSEVLDENGVLVIENAYFLDTVMNREFDQVYHEHMYYYTLRSISEILKRFKLNLIDVYHSSIHGGTMVYVAKYESTNSLQSQRVLAYLQKEKNMHTEEFYQDFTAQIEKNKKDLRNLIDNLTAAGQTIHAYGASAKSTTLFNYYHIYKDTIPFVVDSTITKQGKYIPFANIKVISEEDSCEVAPDYYLLTVWNYKDEIIRKVRESGNTTTKFILPHPKVEIVD